MEVNCPSPTIEDPTVSHRRSEVFAYDAYELDVETGVLRCHYRLDDTSFEETLRFEGVPAADPEPAQAAARLVHLLAGISYYKAGAPPVIDCRAFPLTPKERQLLEAHYIDGLGEFAYVNNLDLSDVSINAAAARPSSVAFTPPPLSPLVPFGGGIDSIVTVEGVRSVADDPSLFIVSRQGDRFDAIERPAAVSDLPIVRAERQLDPKVLRSAELGYLNGHVPVTGILSSLAVLAAVAGGHDAVIMSNERSASVGNTAKDGRSVNHQFSKSAEYEQLLAAVIDETFGGALAYFSYLRPFSELWVAERFAGMTNYHNAFRSCNRAFHLDPALRLDHWCGRCDKCCFIDLALAPFLPPSDLRAVFNGNEPLENPDLLPQFLTLIDASGSPKPFECVGDADECRSAAHLGAQRPDRLDNEILQRLAKEAAAHSSQPLGDLVELMLAPADPHWIPEIYARPLRLV